MMMLPDTETVDAFRRQVHQDVFTRRADTLLAVCDGIVNCDSRCRCLAHVSLGTRHSHHSCYDALTNGLVDDDNLLHTLEGVSRNEGRWYALDMTNVPRPRGRTCPHRMSLHTSGRTRRTHVSVVGWRTSVLARLTRDEDSWTLPLSCREVVPGEDVVEGVMVQLRQLVKASGATIFTPDVVMLDSAYPAAKLTKAVRDENLPVVLVVRLTTTQVFYGDPGVYRGRGRPRLHGNKLPVANPDHGATPPTAELSYPDEVFGQTRVRTWERMHPKTPQLGVVTGTVVRVDVEHLRRGARRSMLALWVSGPVNDLVEVVSQYLRRFDVEHLFRLWKHHLGLLDYHPRLPEQLVRWTQCMMVATTMAYLVRDQAHDQRLPWEKLNLKRLTPVRAVRTLSKVAYTLWVPTPPPRKGPDPSTPPPPPRGKAKRRRKTYRIWRRDLQPAAWGGPEPS